MARNFIAANSERVKFFSPPARLPDDWPITIHCWNFPVNTIEQSVFGVHGANSSDNIELAKRVRTGGNIRYQLVVNAAKVQGTTNIPLNLWHSVTGVVRSDIDRELFVDGVANGTATTSQPIQPYTDMHMGVKDNGADSFVQYFDGDIGPCAIWGTELFLHEIELLAKGVDARTIRPHELVFYAEPGMQYPVLNEIETSNNGQIEGARPVADPPQLIKKSPSKFRKPWFTLLDDVAAPAARTLFTGPIPQPMI